MKFKFNNLTDSREDYVRLDDPNLAQKNPELGEVVRLISTYSPLGRKLLAESSAVRIYSRALTSYLGQATSYWKTELSDQNSVLENVVVLSHELNHNNEYKNIGKAKTKSRPKRRRKKWRFLPDRHVDCISLLRRSLYSEAGAETCAIRVAFEMKLYGYDQVFINSAFVNDHGAKKAKYAALYRLFDASYREACSTTGVDESALLRAGTHVFAAYAQQPALVSAYGMLILEECIDRIAHTVLREYPIMKFKENEGMTYARVADEYLATEARHPASNDQLFKGNELLGQAFDYLAARQVLEVCPAHVNLAKDKAVQRSIFAARSTMRDKNNPFVNGKVKFNEVWKIFKAPDFDGNILKAMSIAAGIDCQLSVDTQAYDDYRETPTYPAKANPSLLNNAKRYAPGIGKAA